MYITSPDIINSKTTFLSFMKKNNLFNQTLESIIKMKFKDEFFDLMYSLVITHSFNDYFEKINPITLNRTQSKQYYINDNFILFAAYDCEATYLVILFKDSKKTTTCSLFVYFIKTIFLLLMLLALLQVLQ